MPVANVWTNDADQMILQMRRGGETWAAIGSALGLSRNTVIERGRRLNAVAPARKALPEVEGEDTNDPNRGPLRAGHRLTWGLLSDQPYPEETTK